jgi:methyl-accepting chemotaxis protein
MNLKDISIKWKTAVPLLLFITVLTITITLVSVYRTRAIVIDSAGKSALSAYRDMALASLTGMMADGTYKEAKGPFLNNLGAGVKAGTVRSPLLDAKLGKGKPNEYPSDDIEKSVVSKGRERVVLEGDYIRGVYPLTASADYRGNNCVSCHDVREGAVLGALSIRMPFKDALGGISGLRSLLLVIGLCGLLALAVVWAVLNLLVYKPLSDLAEDAVRRSSDELHKSINERGLKDEVEILSMCLKETAEVFNETLENIISSIGKVSSALDVLRSTSDITSDGAQSQSSQAIKIATVAEEMSQTINDIAKSAADAADISSGAMKTANEGKSVADESVVKMNTVFESTVELASMVEKLNNRVAEIGDVVTVIKSIADQTNLLALNAAIEAARAGEQGRGFAVVADEVRKLAERTIKATDEVSERVGAIQTESEQTTKSMETATSGVIDATSFIKQVGESLKGIVDTVGKSTDEIARIATSVEEQSAASEEVAENIERSSGISRDIEKKAVSMKKEVDILSQVVEEMRISSSELKLKGTELLIVDLAKKDHTVWVNNVGMHISGEIKLDPETLVDHKMCRLGKWYYGEGIRMCGNLNSFKELEMPHMRIHSIGKEAVMAYDSGDSEKANALYSEMSDVSRNILEHLDGIKNEHDSH